jgi:hypothetical protein
MKTLLAVSLSINALLLTRYLRVLYFIVRGDNAVESLRYTAKHTVFHPVTYVLLALIWGVYIWKL